MTERTIRKELPPGVKLDANVYVTMRDGVKIALDVYRPDKEGKFPAIFSTSPYIKEIQPYSGILSHSIEAGSTFYLVQHDYVHVIGSARGSGLSQGQYNWYDSVEQKDGYEVVEWIARQPWCTGNIGMLGHSYFGRTQWLIAGEQPPHLKTIVPYDASTDDYRSRNEGGFTRMGFLAEWGSDTMLQCFWPGPVEGKLPPTNLYTLMAENPDDGPFWWERSGYKKFNKIKISVLSIAIGMSRLHARSQLWGYPRLQTVKKLRVLPFFGHYGNDVLSHSRPLNDYILRWFDYWLKGIDTGIMEEPEIAICDRVTREWRYENEYPLKRTEWTKFFLHSASDSPAGKPPYGTLSQEPPQREEPDSYTAVECMERAHLKKPVLAYTSPPLQKDLRCWGPVSATLYASTQAYDTGWFVTIHDVSPDGQTVQLCTGALKASYRELDPAQSTPGQPWHPYRNPVLPEPDRIYEYQIEITPMFYTFKKGHQVRVQISSYDVDFLAMHNTVYTSEYVPSTAKNIIYHDAAHQSHLLLPVIPDAPEIKPIHPLLPQVKWPLGDTATPDSG